MLTRRAVEKATLQDLAHQADLIAGSQRTALSPLTHLPDLKPYFARQQEEALTTAAELPASAQEKLAAGEPAHGIGDDRRRPELLRGAAGASPACSCSCGRRA